MTAKITPNGCGHPMTSNEHRRFSDQQIAQAATPTTNTESSAPADPAFERHYRIGELAEMWQLGRETVRLLAKDDAASSRFASDGRRRTRSTPCQNRRPCESTRACSTAASTTLRAHNSPSRLGLPATAGHSHPLRFFPVSFLEHPREAFLPLRDPGTVMQRDRFRVVAERIATSSMEFPR